MKDCNWFIEKILVDFFEKASLVNDFVTFHTRLMLIALNYGEKKIAVLVNSSGRNFESSVTKMILKLYNIKKKLCVLDYGQWVKILNL